MSATPELTGDLGRSAASEADRAILRTVTYAGLFRFPMSPDQLQRRLMDEPVDAAVLRERLSAPFLADRLAVTHGLVHPRGCEEWTRAREERVGHTRALLDRHRFVLGLLGCFPFVRLVALSGGCAHENATDDDVDVFLVVKRDRAWSVCLGLMILAKVLGVRRTLCLNYIVDEAAEALPEQDLFTGAEIVGIKPLAGREGYLGFVAANAWVGRLFPNFFAAYRQDATAIPPVRFPRGAERLLDLGVAPLAEALARRVLGAYLRRRLGPAPGVVLGPHRLKLHTDDHRPRLVARFEAALREAGEES